MPYELNKDVFRISRGGLPLTLDKVKGGFIFQGSVPVSLVFERMDGKSLTAEQERSLSNFYPNKVARDSMGIAIRIFKTKEEAKKAAKEIGAEVQESQSTFRKRSYLGEVSDTNNIEIVKSRGKMDSMMSESSNQKPEQIIKMRWAGAGVLKAFHRGTDAEICYVKPKPGHNPQRADSIVKKLAEAVALAIEYDQPSGSVKDQGEVYNRIKSSDVPLSKYCKYINELPGDKSPMSISQFMKTGGEKQESTLRKRLYLSEATNNDEIEVNGKKGVWRRVANLNIFFPSDGSDPVGIPKPKNKNQEKKEVVKAKKKVKFFNRLFKSLTTEEKQSLWSSSKRSEKKALVNKIFEKLFNNVVVDMMDIPAIYKEIERAADASDVTDVDDAVGNMRGAMAAIVKKFRKN